MKSFFITIILLALAASSCGFVGVGPWREFQSKDGKFKVMFKGYPSKTDTVWIAKVRGVIHFVYPLGGLLGEDYHVEEIRGTKNDLDINVGEVDR